MNQQETARLIGTISLLLLFFLKGIILSRADLWRKYGRAAGLWTVIYIYFLTILRVIFLFKLATREELAIISGWTALIPLVGVILHICLRASEPKVKSQ